MYVNKKKWKKKNKKEKKRKHQKVHFDLWQDQVISNVHVQNHSTS